MQGSSLTSKDVLLYCGIQNKLFCERIVVIQRWSLYLLRWLCSHAVGETRHKKIWTFKLNLTLKVLNGWWVFARTSPWLIHRHTHTRTTQHEATTIPENKTGHGSNGSCEASWIFTSMQIYHEKSLKCKRDVSCVSANNQRWWTMKYLRSSCVVVANLPRSN